MLFKMTWRNAGTYSGQRGNGPGSRPEYRVAWKTTLWSKEAARELEYDRISSLISDPIVAELKGIESRLM
jgi:hypothetical protein